MVYSLGKVLHDARVVLDRNGDDRDLLPVDVSTLMLDEVMAGVIEDAARQVENAAPVEFIDNAVVLMGDLEGGPSVRWRSPGGSTLSGAIVLPSDFMRLVSFRMSDWERALYDFVAEGSTEYKMQSSRFAGVRGTPQRPVAAIVRTELGLELEFHSCLSEDAGVERALYLPYPKIDADDGIDVAERCYSSFIYTVAGMAVANTGEAERSGAYFETAKSVMV